VKMILDAWEDPWCREIWCMKSAQIGITDLAVDVVCHTAACDPSPMAMFLADQITAEKIYDDRIKAGIESVDALEPLLSAASITQKEIKLPNGFNMPIAWASSIAMTGSRPLKRVICDEVAKPGYNKVGKEGSTLGRIRQRLETFADSKLLGFSTPTLDSDLISQQMDGCDVIYDWAVPCPYCGVFQPLRFSPTKISETMTTGGVVWEGGKEATREQIDDAKYRCGACDALWSNNQKTAAVEKGMPMPRETPPERPRKIGIHINRLVSLFPGGRLSSLVQQFIDAQGSPLDLQDFMNSALAEPWADRISKDQDEEAASWMKCMIDVEPMIVPDAAVAVIVGVDVQKGSWWFRVRAFAANGDSWGIYEGQCHTELELEQVIWGTRYKSESGEREYIPWRVLIDTGGGKYDEDDISSTEATYRWIRKNHGRMGTAVYGCKGSSYDMAGNCRIGKPIDKFPSGKPMPGGLAIVQINTVAMKRALLYYREQAINGEPGGMHLHNKTPEWYFLHMTAEELQRDRKTGRVEWRQIRKDNHIMDCEVLCHIGADRSLLGGVAFAVSPEQRRDRKQQEQQQKPKQRQENPFLRGTNLKHGG